MIKLIAKTERDVFDSGDFADTIEITSEGRDQNEEAMCNIFTQFMHALTFNTDKVIMFEEEKRVFVDSSQNACKEPMMPSWENAKEYTR